MTFTFQSPLVSIPLHGLPVAAAALDRNSVIVAANDRFTRLCGRNETTGPGQRLADVVAEQDGAIVEEVPADRLTTRGYGDTRPRATNATEYGRFQNRRIEYAVVR